MAAFLKQEGTVSTHINSKQSFSKFLKFLVWILTSEDICSSRLVQKRAWGVKLIRQWRSCFSKLWCSESFATYISCYWCWGPSPVPADVSALPSWYQLSVLLWRCGISPYHVIVYSCTWKSEIIFLTPRLLRFSWLAASLERQATLTPCPHRVFCWISSVHSPPTEWSSLFSCDQRLIKY